MDAPVAVVGHVPSGGQTPRNFGLSADGALLAVVHQHSKTLVMFDVVEADGGITLTPWASTVSFSFMPVCVRFL